VCESKVADSLRTMNSYHNVLGSESVCKGNNPNLRTTVSNRFQKV
jgi:hypothetical protein